MKLTFESKNLGELMPQSINASCASFYRSQLDIEISEAFFDITIETDGDQLSQAFINLITNAIKYNDKPKPTIKLFQIVIGKTIRES